MINITLRSILLADRSLLSPLLKSFAVRNSTFKIGNKAANKYFADKSTCRGIPIKKKKQGKRQRKRRRHEEENLRI